MKTQLTTQRRFQMPETGLNPDRRTHDLSRFTWFRRPRNKITRAPDDLQRIWLPEAAMPRGTVPIPPGITGNRRGQEIKLENKQSKNKIMKTQFFLLLMLLLSHCLLYDFCYYPRAYCVAAFTDSEPELFFHGYRGN